MDVDPPSLRSAFASLRRGKPARQAALLSAVLLLLTTTCASALVALPARNQDGIACIQVTGEFMGQIFFECLQADQLTTAEVRAREQMNGQTLKKVCEFTDATKLNCKIWRIMQ
jgi:hypothetical protein